MLISCWADKKKYIRNETVKMGPQLTSIISSDHQNIEKKYFVGVTIKNGKREMMITAIRTHTYALAPLAAFLRLNGNKV
jgi:hypothetical protein